MRVEANGVAGGAVTRGMQLTLFAVAMAWAAAANMVAVRAAAGIAGRFGLGAAEPLLDASFLLFLVVVGFRALDRIATRGRFVGQALALPSRPSSLREWGVGAAIGWGLCLVAALPLLVSGNLHAASGWRAGSALAIVAGIATLLLAMLAQEVIFRGYGFQRLIGGIGPAWASIIGSVIFGAVVVGANPPHSATLAVVDCTLLGLLLSMAWLRTHGLWLGWGLNFAYRAVMAVVLGLPVAGHGEYGTPTDMVATGPRWLSGGAFGLDAAVLTGIALLAAMAVLYRATRDWAWEFTAPAIVPAGYEVLVAPPAAHVAMEKAAAPPALVQIMATTPQTRSVVELPPGE